MGVGETVHHIAWSKPDLGSREIASVNQVLKSGWVSQGPVTERFERELAKYANAKHAVFVNNGTSALIAAYMVEGMTSKDTVLIPDYSHIATANAARILGAKIVLVDVDAKTWNMNLGLLEQACRRFHPKFVVTVDVAGLPNDYGRLLDLANIYGFRLIIDGAESFGSEYHNRKVHCLTTSTASFHAAKQLTTIEGGAVFTNDSNLARRVQLIRNHGGAQGKYWSRRIGFNFRPTDLNAAMGLVQLSKLDKAIVHRNFVMRQYRNELCDVLEFQHVPNYVTRHAYMMCLTSNGDRFQEKLGKHGIETRKPWPPIHKQPAYQGCRLVRGTHETVSTMLHDYCLSIPLHNTITDREVKRIIQVIKS